MAELGRLATNLGALSGLHQLNVLNSRLSIAMERISTGRSVNRASDDPASFALGRRQEVKINVLQGAQNNIRDAQAMLQVAESQQARAQDLLLDITTDLQRAVSDTVGSSERTAINTKLQQFISEINDIAADTEFNGVKLLSGASKSVIVQVGQNVGDVLTVTVSGTSANTLSISGITATTRANASAALSKVSKAISALTTKRENVGARMSRLAQKLEGLAVDELNTQAAKSVFVDADIAKESVEFTKLQVLQQAALSVLGQANTAPASLFSLLSQ